MEQENNQVESTTNEEDWSPNVELPSFSRSSNFLVSAVGQIESSHLPEFGDVYCKFCYHYGSDWSPVAGLEEGLTQVAKLGQGHDELNQLSVWNYPLEITFKSSNPAGWPQIVLSVYGFDAMGNDVPRGYGSVLIPPMAGHHRLRVPLFVPESSSLVNKMTAWLSGRRPEFVDPKVVAQGAGRGVLSVRSQGAAFVELNVILKDFHCQGYRSSSSSTHQVR